MLDQDWVRPTTYYGPGDAKGYSSVLCDDVRAFGDLSPEEAADVTISMAGEPILVPGVGPKQRLNASDLAVLLDLLPDDRR